MLQLTLPFPLEEIVPSVPSVTCVLSLSRKCGWPWSTRSTPQVTSAGGASGKWTVVNQVSKSIYCQPDGLGVCAILTGVAASTTRDRPKRV